MGYSGRTVGSGGPSAMAHRAKLAKEGLLGGTRADALPCLVDNWGRAGSA